MVEISQIVRQAVIDAGVLQTGHFVFADGDHALLKLEMDELKNHPHQRKIILGFLAKAPGLPEADVILGVPDGGQYLADRLGGKRYCHLPVVKLERVPGGDRREFRFCTAKDQQLAWQSTSPRIIEDVVTTLSSIHGVVKLLDPERQNIHSLAIWRRGEVKDKYRVGVTDHYLVEELIPSFPPDLCPHPDCQKRRDNDRMI